MSYSLLLILSLACSFAAYPAYAYAIKRQGSRPTRPTWIMILVSDLILFGFMLIESRWDWLLLGFTAGNVMMLVLMASADLKAHRSDETANRDRWAIMLLGQDRWTSKDIASVTVALAALALYAVTGSGITSIVFCLAGKIAASVPMWINLWKEPTREAMLPWGACGSLAGCCMLQPSRGQTGASSHLPHRSRSLFSKPSSWRCCAADTCDLLAFHDPLKSFAKPPDPVRPTRLIKRSRNRPCP